MEDRGNLSGSEGSTKLKLTQRMPPTRRGDFLSVAGCLAALRMHQSSAPRTGHADPPMAMDIQYVRDVMQMASCKVILGSTSASSLYKTHVSTVSMLVSTDEVRDNAKALVAGAARLKTAERRAMKTGISNKHMLRSGKG